jgi:excisionase family DNA binding protein
MNNKSDTKRLVEAVANLAAAITEIIELKIRELAEAPKAGGPLCGTMNRLTATEGWASKQETAEHLKISLGTLSNWMRKGAIPYIKIGKGVRFKLSQVDEAMNRRLRVEARY